MKLNFTKLMLSGAVLLSAVAFVPGTEKGIEIGRAHV